MVAMHVAPEHGFQSSNTQRAAYLEARLQCMLRQNMGFNHSEECTLRRNVGFNLAVRVQPLAHWIDNPASGNWAVREARAGAR